MLNKLQIAIAIIVTILACYGLHSCDVTRLEAKQKDAITAQIKACNANTKITTEIDNGLQTDLANINGRLTSGSVPVAACVPIAAGNTTGNNDTSGSRSSGNTGLSAQWLRQKVAAPGSVYRAQLMACQKLLTEERATP